MKILITGSTGMLGRALCQELSNKYEIIGLDIRRNQKYNFIEADITQRDEAIEKIVKQRPDIVIHAAAYTDVDGCEQNSERTHRVNAQGTETVALASQKCGAFLCYISTDFVFDGEKKTAYIEEDQLNPINIYGKSKLEGEKYVQSILKRFIIVRSSWLFGKGGRNFVDSLLKKAKDEKRIEVVNDQLGSPTYAPDLARAIKVLLSASNFACPPTCPPKPWRRGELSTGLCSIYHITNSGSCSWYEFALAIKEIANLDVDIVPVSSEQYCSPTRRPKMSILENGRYEECAGEKLRHWKEALKEYLLR